MKEVKKQNKDTDMFGNYSLPTGAAFVSVWKTGVGVLLLISRWTFL